MHRSVQRTARLAATALAASALAALSGCAAPDAALASAAPRTVYASPGSPVRLGAGDAFGSMMYAGSFSNDLGAHRFAQTGSNAPANGASMVLTSAPTD